MQAQDERERVLNAEMLGKEQRIHSLAEELAESKRRLTEVHSTFTNPHTMNDSAFSIADAIASYAASRSIANRKGRVLSVSAHGGR